MVQESQELHNLNLNLCDDIKCCVDLDNEHIDAFGLGDDLNWDNWVQLQVQLVQLKLIYVTIYLKVGVIEIYLNATKGKLKNHSSEMAGGGE